MIKFPLQILFSVLVISLLSRCESNDRFYRPNVPEKLCTLGILDIDDTTRFHLRWEDNGGYNNSFFGHYILFEKSYQSEYPEELTDSLKEFSFSISTNSKDIYSYKGDQSIRNNLRVNMTDSLEFLPGEKYYLRARERDCPEISAEVTAPGIPPAPVLLSIKKELVALSEPMYGYNSIDTIKSAVLRISFDVTDLNQFYALIMDSRHYRPLMERGGPVYESYLNYSVIQSNTPGFFAELYGINGIQWTFFEDEVGTILTPIYAYIIDGSKIPGNRCDLTLSTQFHGPYSIWQGPWPTHIYDQENYTSIKMKLLSIPEELFLFEKSLNTYGKTKADPFSEPVYLNGNIKGGNGIFAICRSKDLVINLSPPY